MNDEMETAANAILAATEAFVKMGAVVTETRNSTWTSPDGLQSFFFGVSVELPRMLFLKPCSVLDPCTGMGFTTVTMDAGIIGTLSGERTCASISLCHDGYPLCLGLGAEVDMQQAIKEGNPELALSIMFSQVGRNSLCDILSLQLEEEMAISEGLDDEEE